jgi:hypothetical protein
MPGITFAKTMSDCQLMRSALEPLLKDMPHLQVEYDELGSFLDGSLGLIRQQEDLKGQLRQITRRRREAEQQGQDLYSRVAAQLRGKLGFKNEVLLSFGVPPRRRRVRRSPEAKPPAETPPPADGTSPETR